MESVQYLYVIIEHVTVEWHSVLYEKCLLVSMWTEPLGIYFTKLAIHVRFSSQICTIAVKASQFGVKNGSFPEFIEYFSIKLQSNEIWFQENPDVSLVAFSHKLNRSHLSDTCHMNDSAGIVTYIYFRFTKNLSELFMIKSAFRLLHCWKVNNLWL